MQGLRNMLLQEQKHLQEIADKARMGMSVEPEGHLRISRDKNKPRYYQCIDGNNEIYKLATDVDLKHRTFKVDNISYKVRFNSIYNIYNFVAVISCVSLYQIDPKIIQEALSKFVLNNGRLEEVQINDVSTIINLAKNPTGANVSLRILNEDDDEKELLFVLNDNFKVEKFTVTSS